MFSEQMIIHQPEFCPVKSSGAAASLNLPGRPPSQLDDSPDTSPCYSCEEDHQVRDSCNINNIYLRLFYKQPTIKENHHKAK